MIFEALYSEHALLRLAGVEFDCLIYFGSIAHLTNIFPMF